MILEEFLFVVKNDTVVDGSHVGVADVRLRWDNVSEGRAQVADGFTVDRASEPADDVVDAVHVVSYDCTVGFHEL